MRAILILLLVAVSAPIGQAQEPAEPASLGRDLSASFALPEGLEARVWAESPQFFNPTNIDVDARGRIWVTEAVNYRRFRNGSDDYLHHRAGDRVVILEDSTGDGVCDKSKVFVQDADLLSPLGIAVIGNRVIVSCSPKIFVYTDDDGDDVPDRREVLLEGFGGRDHDHGVHAVIAGPDGRHYFNTGNAGPHRVTDKAGWSLRSGSIYGGGGGLISDDGRQWTGGLMLRMESDGRGLKVLSHNYRNPYELAIDSYGDLWHNDNDDDGNRGCRVSWIMEGSNRGFFSADGSRSWQADRRPGQETATAHWHQDDPGVMPAGDITGAGAPTGIVVYEGDALGREHRGSLLSCDAGRNAIFGYSPVLSGADFRLERRVFMAPAAKGKSELKRPGWFRPSDIAAGTDGALYVADWFDPMVGGHGMQDKRGFGRIYRITRKGRATPVPRLDFKSRAGLAHALASPAINVRSAAREKLDSEGTDELAQLFSAAPTGPIQARYVWLLARSGKRGRAFVAKLLDDPDERLRIAAFRALRTVMPEPLELAKLCEVGASRALDREIAIMLRDLIYEDCRELLIALAKNHDGEDRSYLEAIGIAAEGKEARLYTDLLADSGTQPLRWSKSFADIAWRLHPVAAVPAFMVRALAPQLEANERRRAVDAIAFIEHRDAAEAMVQIAMGGPTDIRALASWWVRHQQNFAWKRFDVAGRLGLGDARPEAAIWRSGRMGQGTREIDIDITGAEKLWLVAADGGDGNSHDWADWVSPVLVGPEGEVSLAALPWVAGKSEWGQVRRDRNCNDGPLVIDGKRYEHGIGTHANSEVLFHFPAHEFTRFKARVGPDDSGTRQSGAKTSLEFAVFVETKAREPDRIAAARAELLAADTDARARRKLAAKLAIDPEGGSLLLNLAARDELPDAIRRTVEDRIFANPDLSVRALASEFFTRRNDEGTAYPTVKELLTLGGDAERGRRIFFGEKAKCHSCHSHSGRGTDLGPDLTAIRIKYERPQVLDAVLNPSAAISFGYESWLIETADGRMNTGFILADGETIILKDTNGKKHVIPAEHIVFRRRQRLSAMPDNVATGLDPQELMDVVSFLRADHDAPPPFGEVIELFNGRDLTGWTVFSPDSKAGAQAWSVKDGLLCCEGRPIGYLRTEADYLDFELELEWRFNPARGPGNSGVLLRLVGEDKVWPKSIEAQLMHRNAGDIWNIDRVSMVVTPARTEGRRTEKRLPSNELPLGQWNRYRIRMDRGELTLAVNGVIQNRAWDCEALPGKIGLQSEGAPIQFRRIRLRPILR